jgi:hypothetical protein
MSLTVITEERNIANALISGLANMAETPTREQVEEKANRSPRSSAIRVISAISSPRR